MTEQGRRASALAKTMAAQLSSGFAGLFTHPLRLFLGYSFLSAWNILLYSSGVLLVNTTNLLPLSWIHLTSSAAVVIGAALIALAAVRLTPLSHKRELLYLIAAIAALATAGIVMVSAGVLGANWMHLCVALTASTGVVLQIAWLEHIATQGIKGTLACLGITTIIGTILQLLITFAPQGAGILITCLLPVLALLTLRPFASERMISYQANDKETTKPQVPTVTQLLKLTPLALTFAAGIIFFSMGAIRTLQLPIDPTIVSLGELLLNLLSSLISIVIALAIALYSYRMNTALAFYVAIPCIMIASLLIAVPTSIPGVLPQTAVNTGTDLVRLLVFMLFIDLSQSKRIPFIFLIALLICVQFAGTLLGQLFAVAIGGNSLLISLVMMVALVVAMLVLVAARSSLRVAGSEASIGTGDDSSDSANRSTERLLEELASTYALSPRQYEVLKIWISGHNSAYIEDQLHISKNTVKTHLNHIYAKTGTANREELLLLMEKHATEKSDI